MVIRQQKWLDGINAGDGYVRQFVATRLGEGYTVEGQVTGEETVGGIQLEMCPMLETDVRFTRDPVIISTAAVKSFIKDVDEMKSAGENGFKPGDVIYMHSAKPFGPASTLRPTKMIDLAKDGVVRFTVR